MKKETSKPLSEHEQLMLARLDDHLPDTQEIPEVLDWTGARRGAFYRSVKQQLTPRLDADVVNWFRQQGSGYQTMINKALREYVGRKER